MRKIVLGLIAALLPLSAQAGDAVTYDVNGEAFEGYSAPSMTGESKGLVVIIHDWDGLTDYEVKRAEMLAGLGYDAFAVDLYGKGNRPSDVEGNKKESGRLYKDRDRMRALLVGGMKAARAASSAKTVVMGYCFGGAAALELARSGLGESVAGYATFHGFEDPPRLAAAKAPRL